MCLWSFLCTGEGEKNKELKTTHTQHCDVEFETNGERLQGEAEEILIMNFSGRAPQRDRRTFWIWCDRVWQNVSSGILLLMDNLEDAFITWNSGRTCRYHPYEIIGILMLIILSVRVMGNPWTDVKGASLRMASLKEENIAGNLFQ